jgi:hypothetical protein
MEKAACKWHANYTTATSDAVRAALILAAGDSDHRDGEPSRLKGNANGAWMNTSNFAPTPAMQDTTQRRIYFVI